MYEIRSKLFRTKWRISIYFNIFQYISFVLRLIFLYFLTKVYLLKIFWFYYSDLFINNNFVISISNKYCDPQTYEYSPKLYDSHRIMINVLLFSIIIALFLFYFFFELTWSREYTSDVVSLFSLYKPNGSFVKFVYLFVKEKDPWIDSSFKVVILVRFLFD